MLESLFLKLTSPTFLDTDIMESELTLKYVYEVKM